MALSNAERQRRWRERRGEELRNARQAIATASGTRSLPDGKPTSVSLPALLRTALVEASDPDDPWSDDDVARHVAKLIGVALAGFELLGFPTAVEQAVFDHFGGAAYASEALRWYRTEIAPQRGTRKKAASPPTPPVT